MWSSEKNRDPPSPNFTLISGDSQCQKSYQPKNTSEFLLLLTPKMTFFVIHTANFADPRPPNFTKSVTFLPLFFWRLPYDLPFLELSVTPVDWKFWSEDWEAPGKEDKLLKSNSWEGRKVWFEILFLFSKFGFSDIKSVNSFVGKIFSFLKSEW